ncbi:peroxisomal leader peptide-processing protease [Euwallacea similis]|uniref:peroxisomal leader peptide-processing protease n=1 Tax=Euwallacea similis TaxID=1736056 RepID=UPI00344CBD9C
MDVEAVLIETKYKHTIKSSSATLINQKYIFTTCHILLELLQKNIELLHQLPEGQLCLYTNEPIIFHVLWKNNSNSDTFVVKRARLFALFKSRILSQFYNNDFRDWSANPEVSRGKNVNLSEAISVFLILVIEDVKASAVNLEEVVSRLFKKVSSLRVAKCDQIVSVSTPFGSREFFNSISEGIVSASLMESGLFLSDCSSAPGCEGGLVYLSNCSQRQKFPVGIIISSFNWWRKDWVGFTLIVDISSLLVDIIQANKAIKTIIQNREVPKVLDLFENSLVQIKCGSNWGTGIVLCKKKGIIITNSHVVISEFKIYIFWKSHQTIGHLVYKSPKNSAFDWAVIRVQSSFDNWFPLNSAKFYIGTYSKGDQVYAAGYSLLSNNTFPKELTITKGIINACNTSMIQTSCSVYPGFSGGGIFTSNGMLLGLTVCNIKLIDIGETYSKFNMALPINLLREPLCEYLKTEDSNVLLRFAENFQAESRNWNILNGKL